MYLSSFRQRQRGNAAGKLLTIVLVLGLLGLGGWLVSKDMLKQGGDSPLSSLPSSLGGGVAVPEPAEPVIGTPVLQSAAPYEMKNNIIDIDMSEYAGYGGLIVANGGLAPNPESIFAKQYGFQLRLSKGESEEWSALNNGQMAAVATTADVLAVLGRQFEVTVPAQIAFSRGADQVVVDTGIASINQLKGKVLGATQFNESEFFIRYLASEAGVPVKVLRDLDARPAPNELGLVFYEDAFIACDAYAAELTGKQRLNGCVGWSPRTDEVVAESAGAAKMLVSNRNLLVVADILVVNKGFATAHPDKVKGLVHGLLEGNRLLRDDPQTHAGVVAQAFGWTQQETLDELGKVHLSNLPENLAFFDGSIDSAGSFQGIFQSSVLAYGALIRNPADPARFADLQHLKALDAGGQFQGQSIAIAPIRTSGKVALEGDALLSKDIRFFFEANSAALDKQAKANQDYLDTIKKFLQVSPALVKSMALKAMELSRQRTLSVKEALLARRPGIADDRIELVGRGWEEPLGQDSEQNRRVEVQWFTLE